MESRKTNNANKAKNSGNNNNTSNPTGEIQGNKTMQNFNRKKQGSMSNLNDNNSNSFKHTYKQPTSFKNTIQENSEGTINKPYHNTSVNINNNRMEAQLLERTFYEPLPVDTSGNKPHARFGHTMISLTPVKMVLFGGAVGETKRFEYSNETYIYNVMTKIWIRLSFRPNTPLPKPRAAHAVAANDNLQMVIHGGSAGGGGLADDQVWMLDLNNLAEDEGRWCLLKIAGKSPGARYGHSMAFIRPFFILFGGNFNPVLSNDVFMFDASMKTLEWVKVEFKNNVAPCPRVYHSCAVCPKGNCAGMMIIFGGRDSNENPLNDIWGLTRHKNGIWEWNKAPIKNNAEMKSRFNHSMIFYDGLMIVLGGKTHHSGNGYLPIEIYNTESGDLFEFPGIYMNRQVNFLYENNIFLYGGFNSKNQNIPISTLLRVSLEKLFENSFLYKKLVFQKTQAKMSKLSTTKSNHQKKMQFKLTHEVVIGSGGLVPDFEEESQMQDETSLFRKLSIDKLQEEGKRIGDVPNKNLQPLVQNKYLYNKELVEKVINNLLRPFDWFDKEKMDELHSHLPFDNEEISELIQQAIPFLENDKSLVRIRSPCKIFGNIYGCYNDLMRYFESYGNPSDDNQMGDINVMQYIFLGDFCDRGFFSLEVVLLLLALKIKYPDFIYLIRGHHEDSTINKKYGLGNECAERLNEDIEKNKSVFNLINSTFNFLPFGVLVDNTILLVHGGIGSSINSLEDIESIKRPVKVEHNVTTKEQLKVIDLLWSEYSDEVKKIDVNKERDKGKKGFIVRYGPDRVNEFIQNNKITLIITAHKFIKEGFSAYNNDKLLSVFSATNYMDKYANIGGMITIAKKTVSKPVNIIPKLINIYETKQENYRKNRSPSPVRK